MIAIIGKIAVGKSTFIKQMKKIGYKTFVCDDFIHEGYKKNGIFYQKINHIFGTKFNNENGIDINLLKSSITKNNHNLEILENIIYPELEKHLKNNHYDFVEIPKLISKNFNFSALFNLVLCLETPTQKWCENLKNRNVDNFLKKEIMKKNNPFLIKKQLFGQIPIVNIYGYNFSNEIILNNFLQILLLYV
ncbi:UNVERIFIED_CONTAM: dephospho-CoA kinase [Campylobacter lari]